MPPTPSAPTPNAEPRLSPVRTIFRTLAFAEAVSWAALLVAMFFKWVVQEDPHAGIEGGVPVAGMIHGIVFVLYVLAAITAWAAYGWSLRTGILALAAAIPPFFTVWFEVVADRRGLLGVPARPITDTEATTPSTVS